MMTRSIVCAAGTAAELSALLAQIASNSMYSYSYNAALPSKEVWQRINRELLEMNSELQCINSKAMHTGGL